MAGDCGSEAGVTHSRGMAIADWLHEDGIGGDLIPVDLEMQLENVLTDFRFLTKEFRRMSDF